jgi:hypothetical protein
MGNVIPIGKAAQKVVERFAFPSDIIPTDPTTMARLEVTTQLEDSVSELRCRDAAIAALDGYERAIKNPKLKKPKLMQFLREMLVDREERA